MAVPAGRVASCEGIHRELDVRRCPPCRCQVLHAMILDRPWHRPAAPCGSTHLSFAGPCMTEPIDLLAACRAAEVEFGGVLPAYAHLPVPSPDEDEEEENIRRRPDGGSIDPDDDESDQDDDDDDDEEGLVLSGS